MFLVRVLGPTSYSRQPAKREVWVYNLRTALNAEECSPSDGYTGWISESVESCMHPTMRIDTVKTIRHIKRKPGFLLAGDRPVTTNTLSPTCQTDQRMNGKIGK